MADFTSLNGYNVKDKYARENMLPKTGGTVTGDILIKKADNGEAKLNKNHNSTTDQGFYLIDCNKDGERAWLKISANDGVVYFSPDGSEVAHLYGAHNKELMKNFLLALEGGTLSGTLKMDVSDGTRGFGEIYKNNEDGKEFGIKVQDTDKDGDMVGIHINASSSSLAKKLSFYSFPSGETGKSYNIFGEHNKTSGSYTGNGSAASRTIETGGLSKVVLITGGGSVLLTPAGGYKLSSGTISSLGTSDCSFNNGVLTLTTIDTSLNTSGKTYYYQVL